MAAVLLNLPYVGSFQQNTIMAKEASRQTKSAVLFCRTVGYLLVVVAAVQGCRLMHLS